MRCSDIECCVARHYGVRQNIIVPNVSWGLGVHECDLFVVSPSGYATEIEIKTSKSDLKKDFEKWHKHKSKLIKYLYFAFPESLLELAIELLPLTTGMFVVCENEYYKNNFYVRIQRSAVANPLHRQLTESEIKTVSRLGCMRIWGLKDRVNDLVREKDILKKELKAKLK